MRTIAEIKEEMCKAWMANQHLAEAYGFNVGDAWSDHYNSVSVENLLLYVVACSIYVLEGLLESHKTEVEAEIDEMMPHRPKWYRDKALAFMKDMVLSGDSDQYDTSDMSEQDIAAAHVVRYAAATESADASLLTIKVAGEEGGELCPLDSETEVQLLAYLQEVKDAGVPLRLVNQPADLFSCEVNIYYDAMLTAASVQEKCRKAIEGYIRNLPFNGEYTNMGLVDALQAVTGVKVVHFGHAVVQVDNESTPTPVEARHRPAAGYMTTDSVTINMIVYDEQV